MKQLLQFVLIMQFASAIHAQVPPVQTSIANLRELSREKLAASLPVQVKGVVTWHSQYPIRGFIIDDGKTGIYCDLTKALGPPHHSKPNGFDHEAKIGNVLIVEGVTNPGFFAPMILVTSVHKIGRTVLPQPKAVSYETLFSGVMDSQRISLIGVVRAARRDNQSSEMKFEVGTAYGTIQVVLIAPGLLNGLSLVDASVRFRGCLLPLQNARSEIIGVSLQTNLQSDLEILKPAPTDPFQAPSIESLSLRPFSINGIHLHRLKVCGVVTSSQPGSFVFLQRENYGFQVFTAKSSGYEPGDIVEAAGFVDLRNLVGDLENASLRKVGRTKVPDPQFVDAKQLITSFGEKALANHIEDWDNRLVTLEGRLVSVQKNRGETKLVLASGGRFIPVYMQSAFSPHGYHDLKLDSIIHATGVVSLTYSGTLPTSRPLKVIGVNIYTRTPTDIKLIKPAPWWTPTRVRWTLGLGISIIAASALWIVSLQRIVIRQARRLHEALRVHRDSEIEYAATQRERMRLAHDLHDGFQQLIAGTMFRLNAALSYLPRSPEQALEQLQCAKNTLQHTQGGLRDALWGLTEVGDGPPNFSGMLRQAACRLDHWNEVVEVRLVGEERPLSPHLVGNLLMLFQEAVGNAIKHGEATQVDVEVNFGKDGLTLRVQDNGKGFDPAKVPDRQHGHLGLGGMDARMQWLGGTLKVHSKQGEGTRITAFLSWEKAKELKPAFQEQQPKHVANNQPHPSND